MDPKPSGSPAARSGQAAHPPCRFQYRGPKDVGRADSLYRSALAKPDLDYASQLLFSALLASPEQEEAFRTVLDKMIPAYAAEGRKMILRVSDLFGGSPADAFLRALVAYCAAPTGENALACMGEAQKAGLHPHAAALGERVLRQLQSSPLPAAVSGFRGPSLMRLVDVLEACGAVAPAVDAARVGQRLFPEEQQAFRQREKNLLASQYLEETDIASASNFRETLRDRHKQELMHRAGDPNARLDELERRYRQDRRLEDFREWVRALRESSEARRESALDLLEEGYERFGDKETLWFLREVRLERRRSELRLHKQVVDGSPGDAGLAEEHRRLRQEVVWEQIEHLYEVVGSLPPTPERQKRELELAGHLMMAGRYEEAIKQAQSARRRAEGRVEAWVVMARAFVQLGFTPEATECFRSALAELDANPQGGSAERALEARYSYAEFLVAESEKKRDAELARQARRLCSEIMIQDIDFRDVRRLSARADAASAQGPAH